MAEGFFEVGRGRPGVQQDKIIAQEIFVRGEGDVGDLPGLHERPGLGCGGGAEDLRGGAQAREIFPIEGSDGFEAAIVADARRG